MTIHPYRTIFKSFFVNNPILAATPIIIIIALLPLFSINFETIEQHKDRTAAIGLALLAIFPIIILLMILLRVLFGLGAVNATQVLRTANIEKRMEKLKKLGADKFIEQTDAKLVDVSERGNRLYISSKVLPAQIVKFLVYKDKSTDREYISFVEDNFENADEAMASKFSLSELEYAHLKLENEA